MEKGAVSILGGDEFFSNRNLSRNSSVGCSSRIYYYRSTEGVPFNWEMQPGTPRDPPKQEAIPPISPPPAVISLGLPRPIIDNQPNKPPTPTRPRLRFWRKSKKNCKQNKSIDILGSGGGGGSGKFDRLEFGSSSDCEFVASPPRNSSSSRSSSTTSSFSFSKGRVLSRQCSSLRSTPARECFSGSKSGHFSCSPWNFSAVLVSIARRV